MNWVRVAVKGPHLSWGSMGPIQGQMKFANAGIPKRDVVTALLKSLLSKPPMYLLREG